MISVGLTSSTSASLALKPSSLLLSLKPIQTRYHQLKTLNQERRSKSKGGKCRAILSADAPVALAIGSCILSSLIIPEAPLPEDAEAESLIDSADARFAVVGIISFIPYFNWMSWVFAWLGTQKPRYAVYAVVYLAPYLSLETQALCFPLFLITITMSAFHRKESNLSLSPEESWLPIVSIVLGIIHIQLEASIRSGDIQGFHALNEAQKLLSSLKQGKRISKETEERNDFHNLPSAQEHYRSKIRDWATTQIRQHDSETINGGDKESKGDSEL